MEVFRRFALSYSSIWAEEVARYAFIYVSWIGASAAIKERAHIRIDLILPIVGDRGRAVIMIIGDLITIVLAVLAFWWPADKSGLVSGCRAARVRHDAYAADSVHHPRCCRPQSRSADIPGQETFRLGVYSCCNNI